MMRKAMMKYGSKSTDIIKTKGATMKIVTVNAKGAWTRTLDTEKPVHQVRACYLAYCYVHLSQYLDEPIEILAPSKEVGGQQPHNKAVIMVHCSKLQCACREMLWASSARPALSGMAPYTSLALSPWTPLQGHAWSPGATWMEA